jgi:renalase
VEAEVVAEVLVVGAGVAGLLAARALTDHGHGVTVVDKGFRPGGRLATRRVGAATFDTGAQFLTVGDARVAAHLDDWLAAGAATEWFRGSPDHPGSTDGGRPRYRGVPTMRALAEHLAGSLDLQLARRVVALGVRDRRWALSLLGRDGRPRPPLTGDAVLLTPPTPQTRALLQAVPLHPETRRVLAASDFAPCLAVLAVPHRPPALPERGARRFRDPAVAWVTDNQATGASTSPALTVHATTAFSRARWHAPDVEVAADLLRAARLLLDTSATPVRVHRWRYAAPVAAEAERHATTLDPAAPALFDRSAGPPLAIAGDGLAGGRVEAAARSGLAAADRLHAALR